MFSLNRLKAARKMAGLNQTALAKAAGISPTVISNYEAGNYQPSHDTQVKLADALGIQVEDLHEQDDAAADVASAATADEKHPTVGDILAKAKEDLAAILGVKVAQIRLEMGVTS